MLLKVGRRGWTRTSDPQLRRLMLYPPELRARKFDGSIRYTQSNEMDHSQMLVLALANMPTIITVLIGILLNNGRLSDLNNRLTSSLGTMENRFGSMESTLSNFENRLTNLDQKFDTRFDLLLGKVVDLYNRLTRIEAQLH
jgi:hypothetical protein